jgi:hypothetical protein
VTTREVAETVLQLKGLVHVRAILEDRGASEAELAAHTAEIERVRERLADLARDAEGLPTAA